MSGIKIQTFTNADLNIDNEYVYVHNLNTTVIIPTWTDDTGLVRNSPDLFEIVDANTITVFCSTPITGDNTLTLIYDNALVLAGRKLFALSETLQNAIEDTHRLAIGRDGISTSNITMLELYALLQSKLDFLNVVNMSQLTNQEVQSIQLSLDIYPRQTLNLILALYPYIYQTLGQANACITSNNAIEYNPTQNSYNPATTKYVDVRPIEAGQTFSGVPNANLTNRTIMNVRTLDFGVGTAGGKIYSINFEFDATNVSGGMQYLGTLSGITSTATRTFTCCSKTPTTFQTCYVEIRIGGEIWVNAGLGGNTWVFNQTYVA